MSTQYCTSESSHLCFLFKQQQFDPRELSAELLKVRLGRPGTRSFIKTNVSIFSVFFWIARGSSERELENKATRKHWVLQIYFVCHIDLSSISRWMQRCSSFGVYFIFGEIQSQKGKTEKNYSHQYGEKSFSLSRWNLMLGDIFCLSRRKSLMLRNIKQTDRCHMSLCFILQISFRRRYFCHSFHLCLLFSVWFPDIEVIHHGICQVTSSCSWSWA